MLQFLNPNEEKIRKDFHAKTQKKKISSEGAKFFGFLTLCSFAAWRENSFFWRRASRAMLLAKDSRTGFITPNVGA